MNNLELLWGVGSMVMVGAGWTVFGYLMGKAPKEGIDVTVIENGDIALPPHKYGFIGGAAGVFGKEIFFLGDYRTHRSADLIESAILNAGFTPIALSDEPLSDLGRIIFLE